MALWSEFIRCVCCLRSACTRHRTFLWLAVVLIAWAARPDLCGVASFVRASYLKEQYYRHILHLFHSSAVVLSRLLKAWVRLAMNLFTPISEGEFTVVVADGLKVAKEGTKMPAVKCLHQESNNNSKAEFIMGHSIQVLSLLVTASTGQVFAVPLVARICEGLIWGRAYDNKSLLDKLVDMLQEVAEVMEKRVILVADAYYASKKIILPLLKNGHVLISRVKRTTVAYESPPEPKVRKRGRPKKYGSKIQHQQLFKAAKSFIEATSPVYGEKGGSIIACHEVEFKK